MFKRVLLASSLLLGIASPAIAEQWVYINSSSDGHVYYLDFDSVRGTDYDRSFWYREVSRGTNHVTSETLLSVDCVFWESTLLETVYYPSGDRYVPLSPHMTPLQRPSILNDMAAFVCERARGVHGMNDHPPDETEYPTDTGDYPID